MEKIFFTIDSPADLPDALIGRLTDFEIIPLHIILGDESFSDGVDITPQQVVEYTQSSGELPKTAAVSIGEYTEVFTRLTSQGYKVVHIALSSGVSSTYMNSCVAAESVPGVYPVDSLLLTTSMALLLIKADEMRSAGVGAAEIAANLLELREKVKTAFIINSLTYLYKGGRCSGLAVLGANLLSIKPCIEMRGGKLYVGKKYRGKYDDCQLSYVKDVFAGCKEPDKSVCILDYTQGMTQKQEQALLKEIRHCCKFKEILVARPGCTITSHCGPDTMAVLFIEK